MATRVLYPGVDITVFEANDKTVKELSGTEITCQKGKLLFTDLA